MKDDAKAMITNQMDMEQLMFNKLKENYFGLYYIDLDEGNALIMKTGHEDITGKAGTEVNYGWLIDRISGASEGDAAAFLKRARDIDYIKQYFATKDLAYYRYKSYIFEGNRWVAATGLVLSRHEEGVPSAFALGFSLLDEESCEKEEAQKKSMEVVEGLASEYTALYHVNLDTDDYVSYHLIEKTEDIKPYYEANPKFTDLAHGFAGSLLVRREDSQKLHDFYPSSDIVKERMKDKKLDTMLFKRNYGGEFLWTELSIVKCEDEHDEAHNIVVGFKEKDREVEEYFKAFEKTDEINKLVDNVVSKYNVAFTINMANDDFKLMKFDDRIEHQFEKFSSYSGARAALKDILHNTDKERIMHEMEYDTIREKIKETRTYTIEYRAVIEDITKWHEMNVAAIDADEVVLGFAEKDLEITKRHLEDKRYDEYLALFVIDLDTEMIKPLKTSRLFASINAGAATPYEESMGRFASKYQGEAAEFFKKISKIDYLKENFRNEDKRTYSYKATQLENKWIDVVSYVILRHDDGTPAMLSLGFSVVDTMATARKELLDRLNENMQMIGGLASEYNALFYVNIDEDRYDVVTLDREKHPEISELVSNGGSPFEILRKFGQSEIVHPEDRKLLRNISADGCRELLAGSKKFTDKYRILTEGEYVWYEMEIIKYEDIDEQANAIAIGFIDREAEIRAEQAINRSFEVLGEELTANEAISRILSIVGEFYTAEHCYVFEYAKRIGTINNTYEWCADGIEPTMDKLQNVPMEVAEGWNNEFERQGAFYIDALDSEYNTDETRAILEMQGTDSLVVAPLLNGNEIVGFIGVNNPTKEKKNINILTKAASVVFREILQRKENDEEHVTLGKLTDAFLSVYYADLSTDYMRAWKMTEEYVETYGTVQNYSVSMGGYVRNNIAERDRERCIRMTSPEYVLEQFRTRDRFSVDMTDIMLGYERSLVVDFIKVNENGTRLVICARDVTETLAAEKEQQKQLEKNMQMISGLASGYNALFYINIDDNVLQIYALDEAKYPVLRKSFEGNETDFYKIIGGYGLSDQVHPDDRHLFDNFSPEWIRKMLCGKKKFSIRFRAKTEDGYRWDDMEFTKYEDLNEEANAVAIGFTDRDADIRREQEYQQQLEEARNVAEAANKAKTDFLFNMSHDIRTPMNAINGFTNMAIKHIDDRQRVADCLTKTQHAGRMLLSLINSVLEMSRIESGNAKVDEQPGDVYDSFVNVEVTMREMAVAKDIDISFEFGEITDRFVYADSSRCMRVFVNVISNAIKYTREGGYVKVKCEQIEKAKDGYGRYRYTVEDNGIGMSEEFQKHVFDQFTREETATVSGVEGTGLGLAVCKSFVELLGGTIECKSRQGAGTTFTIDLPLRIQDGENYTGPVSGIIVSSGGYTDIINEINISGEKVLLVEDNKLNREIAIDILEEEGVIVEEAEDGTVAVEMLREKGPDYYDFILMDIQMPKMNGYEATKEIRNMYPDSHIPIIALSANAFAEDRHKSIEAGMDDHVAKPIDLMELFSCLKKHLK